MFIINTTVFFNNKYSKWYYNIVNNALARTLPPNTYTEKHHVLPKSIGGSNSVANLIKLTANEHRLLHLLLPKMTIDRIHTRSMWYAAWMIIRAKNNNQKRNLSKGKLYSIIKQQIAQASREVNTGKIVSDESKKKMSDAAKGRVSPFKGKKHKKESLEKMSDSLKGKIPSKETRDKISISNLGQKRSEETKQKISENNLGKHRIPKTQEQKDHLSQLLKDRIPTWLVGKPSHNKGKSFSEETKQKMKNSHKNREIIKCPYCNRDIPKPNYKRWHGGNCKNKI